MLVTVPKRLPPSPAAPGTTTTLQAQGASYAGRLALDQPAPQVPDIAPDQLVTAVIQKLQNDTSIIWEALHDLLSDCTARMWPWRACQYGQPGDSRHSQLEAPQLLLDGVMLGHLCKRLHATWGGVPSLDLPVIWAAPQTGHAWRQQHGRAAQLMTQLAREVSCC